MDLLHGRERSDPVAQRQTGTLPAPGDFSDAPENGCRASGVMPPSGSGKSPVYEPDTAGSYMLFPCRAQTCLTRKATHPFLEKTFRGILCLQEGASDAYLTREGPPYGNTSTGYQDFTARQGI